MPIDHFMWDLWTENFPGRDIPQDFPTIIFEYFLENSKNTWILFLEDIPVTFF